MFLDTHAVVFLHAGRIDLFSETAKYLLETEELWASPMVLLELQYLHEIERIKPTAEGVMDDLRRELGLRILDRRWEEACRKALEQTWTRDPFDRFIAAQALVEVSGPDQRTRLSASIATWPSGIEARSLDLSQFPKERYQGRRRVLSLISSGRYSKCMVSYMSHFPSQQKPLPSRPAPPLGRRQRLEGGRGAPSRRPASQSTASTRLVLGPAFGQEVDGDAEAVV
jgi:PIN domain nuclease of toxin-antitoxin system